MKRTLFGVMLVWLACMAGLASAQDDADTLVVDAAQPLGTISPYVYGANHGLYGLLSPEMIPNAQALNLGYLRFGGGDSDRRNLQKSWVDLFVFQAREIGAEPAMTVRLLGGTPEQAAEMVRYANIEKGHNIRYWSIGNEPNLFAALMDVPYSTEDLNREWRAIAEAMLAVDPEIILVGPDITQYVILNIDPDNLDNIEHLEGSGGGSPYDRDGRDWMLEFLRANGDLVDVVSIHRYPYPGAGGSSIARATIEGLRVNSQEWDVIIPNLRQLIREVTGRDIPIAVTEFNSDSNQSAGGEAGLDTFYNAIWLADVLGRLIKNQVDIASYWDLQGQGNRSWGLMERYNVRPTYYAYLMYSHFGTELLASDSADADVPVYAALRDDGALTVMVVNLGPDEKIKTLDIRGFDAGGPAEVWRFDAEHQAEQIDPADVGSEVTLPGQSVTLYVIPAA